MYSHLTWNKFDPLTQRYLIDFATQNAALRGETAILRLRLTANPLITPAPLDEHKTFGVANFQYKSLTLDRVMFEAPFTIGQFTTALAIPAAEVDAWAYQGDTVKLGLELEVEYLGKTIARLPFQNVLRPGLVARNSSDTLALDLLRPADVSNLARKLESLPAKERSLLIAKMGGFAASLVLALMLLPMTFALPTAPKSGNVLGGMLVLYVVLGLFFAPKLYRRLTQSSFGSYASLRPTKPAQISRTSSLKVSDLFEGKASIDLRDVTLRLIAVQEERFVYQFRIENSKPSMSHREYRGVAKLIHKIDADLNRSDALIRSTPIQGGASLVDHQHSKIIATCLLYEKTVALIPAGEPIQAAFTDALSLETFFARLGPASLVDAHCGLSLEWRLQLIHPSLQDIELLLELDFDPASFVTDKAQATA